MYPFVVLGSVFSKPIIGNDWLGMEKTNGMQMGKRLRNDLFCVEPQSVTAMLLLTDNTITCSTVLRQLRQTPSWQRTNKLTTCDTRHFIPALETWKTHRKAQPQHGNITAD